MKISRSHRRLVLAAMGFALGVVGCSGGTPDSPPATKDAERPGSDRERSEERVELSPEALAAASIQTQVVARQTLREEIRATAVVKVNENRLAHVSPRIPGRAVEVRALLGSVVEPGQVLAHLDSLELGEKKSAFLQARTSLEVARRNYEREQRLFKRQISSEKEYLEAKGEFERSEATYQAAREALRLLGIADGELERITWGGGKAEPLSHFPLVAPFVGTVIAQHVTLGELVKPEDTPFTITDLSTLWILIDVFEKQLPRVAVGQSVQVIVDAYPDEKFAGRITYMAHVLDERTRAAQARVEMDNHDGRLRPGMFATAVIDVAPPEGRDAIVLPSEAIQSIHGKPFAFIEEKPGHYATRELTLGKESRATTEIASGVASGDRVVIQGAFYLKAMLLKEEVGGGED